MTPRGANFTVFKSSAGSGKTYTLVREYLKIILKNPEDFRHLLAITFTNKAANEMKERVLRYLRTLADPVAYPDDVVSGYLLPALVKETSLPQDELTRRAGIALGLILHQYGDFSVSTIDSFFHRVVRTFAHDLRIPQSFMVLLEEKEALEEVVRLMLDRVGSDEELTEILVRFIHSRADEEQSWDIEKDLAGFSEVLIRESSLPYIERLAEIDPGAAGDARDSIWIILRRTEDHIADKATGALHLVRSTGLNAEAFVGGSTGLVPWLEDLSNRKFGELRVKKSVRDALEKNVWTSGKAGRDEKAVIGSIASDLAKKTAGIVDYIDQNSRRYFTLKVLNRYIYPLAVLGAIERELQAYREDNNILLISELNRRIYEVVSTEPIPFVYERLGEKYHHFLIDEFQDTSVLQWHNFLPLLENALAQGRFNMVVGDGKQAIYRFRAGDVRQFEILPQVMNPGADPLLDIRQQALARNFDLQRLDSNYRSAGTIVEFNNRFFTLAQSWLADSLKPVYSDVSQKTGRKGEGFVRIEFLKEEENGESFQEVTLRKVKETILNLNSAGVPGKDIAILCRFNRHASMIASFLLTHGISVVSAESLLLGSSPEVNFLVAWLRWIVNPKDAISRYQISLYLSLQGIPEVPKPESILSKLSRKDLYHLVSYLSNEFIPHFALDPYLLAFKDQLIEFMRADYQALEDFLEWWDEKGSDKSVVTPEGSDSVRVMTIHKAKGLEFPVVLFPFATEQAGVTLSRAWVDIGDPELAPRLPFAYINLTRRLEGTDFQSLYALERESSMVDMLNILYVALTRASDQLHVFSRSLPKDRTETDSIPKMLFRFLEKEGVWSEEKTVYTYGEPPAQRPKGPVVPAGTVPLTLGAFSDWRGRIALRSSAPECWSVDDPEKAFTRGQKIHYVLSLVQGAGDSEKAVREAFIQGIIGKEEYDGILETVGKFVEDPATSFIFAAGWKMLNEREIIDRDGGIHRPDRLMIRDREAVVVDYKTGRPSDMHASQVRKYAGLLTEMGYTIHKACIVYLGETIKVVTI